MQGRRKPLLAPLLVLLMSLAGCAQNLPKPPQVLPEVARPVPPVELMEPEPANYSEHARQTIKRWREMLTGSPGS